MNVTFLFRLQFKFKMSPLIRFSINRKSPYIFRVPPSLVRNIKRCTINPWICYICKLRQNASCLKLLKQNVRSKPANCLNITTATTTAKLCLNFKWEALTRNINLFVLLFYRLQAPTELYLRQKLLFTTPLFVFLFKISFNVVVLW